MAIIVNSIITSLTEDRQEAIRKAVGILEVPEPLVQSAYIAKTSLDARRRGDIRFVHSVSVTLADGEARVAERAQAKGKRLFCAWRNLWKRRSDRENSVTGQ